MLGRNILTVAGKEFRHLSHDRFALTLIILLPVVQLLIYGYALDTQTRHVAAAVLNRDSSSLARELVKRISGSSLFSVQPGYYSEADLEAGLRTEAIRVGVAIPAGFSTDLIAGRRIAIRVWVDGADVATSNYLLSSLNALTFASGPSAARIEIQPKILFNSTGRTAAFMIPGLIAILVQTIATLLMALSIATERERGTLEQLLVTRIGTGTVIAGKALAIASVGLLECFFLVFLMRTLFSIPIVGSIMLLIAIIPLFVLVPIGLGLLIASRARTQFQALQLANLVLLPSVMLSGFVFPREFLNAPIDWLSKFVPATYLVDLTRNIVLRGATMRDVAAEILIVVAFGIFLTAAGALSLRNTIE